MVTTSTPGYLIDKFRIHQDGIGRADGTVERYRNTFLLFTRYLESEGLEATRDCLKSETMNRFASWMRATPANEHHGAAQRAESGIHAHLRDPRAFTRWLTKNG